MAIKKISWNGTEAVELEAGGYEALLVPSVGANLVRLRHTSTGADILHTPAADEMETFAARPQIFGLPLLFPPNRIADGKYTYKGMEYRFPITLPAQNNYLHGIIKSQPFIVTRTEEGEGYAEVEASFFSNKVNDAIYVNYPHQFVCRMIFRLSAEGLTHTVTFTNLSDREMPLGVGYHTPINVPFIKGADKRAYRLRLSAGKRWEMDERLLPTGKLNDLSPEEALLRGEGIDPTATPVEWAVTAEPIKVDGRPYNGAVMIDTANDLSVCYEVDDRITNWTLWNNKGEADWACPEPQSWVANAPNLDLDPAVTGFQAVAPGATWQTVSRIYVK